MFVPSYMKISQRVSKLLSVHDDFHSVLFPGA